MEEIKKCSVLLIEDNDDHAELIDFYINEVCQETVETKRLPDGEQAMGFIQGFHVSDTPPDLILLDLKLPKYDGHEVLKAFKKNEILRSVPIIIFTTSNSRKDINMAYKNGANSYILKPIEAGKIRETVEKIFDYWSMNEKGGK
ncbi:MAG: response regulator [Candidatus Electrothrix sp. YB6]